MNITNQKLLESVEGLKTKTISGIIRMTERVGLGTFDEATVVPDEFGYFVRVRNEEGTLFYFSIDEDGFVVMVQSDSPRGRILFMPIDD